MILQFFLIRLLQRKPLLELLAYVAEVVDGVDVGHDTEFDLFFLVGDCLCLCCCHSLSWVDFYIIQIVLITLFRQDYSLLGYLTRVGEKPWHASLDHFFVERWVIVFRINALLVLICLLILQCEDSISLFDGILQYLALLTDYSIQKIF